MVYNQGIANVIPAESYKQLQQPGKLSLKVCMHAMAANVMDQLQQGAHCQSILPQSDASDFVHKLDVSAVFLVLRGPNSQRFPNSRMGQIFCH